MSTIRIRRDVHVALHSLAHHAGRHLDGGRDPFPVVLGSGLFAFHARIPVPIAAQLPDPRLAAHAYALQARASLARLDVAPGEDGDPLVPAALHEAWVPLAQAIGLGGWGRPGSGTHPSLLAVFTDLGPAGDTWIDLAALGPDGIGGLVDLAIELLDAGGLRPAASHRYVQALERLLGELASVRA